MLRAGGEPQPYGADQHQRDAHILDGAELLIEREHADSGRGDDAYAGPDRIRDADRQHLHGRRQRPETGPVAGDGERAPMPALEAVGELQQEGAGDLERDGETEVDPSVHGDKVTLNVVSVKTSQVVYSVQGAGEYALSSREILGTGGEAGLTMDCQSSETGS